LALIITSISFVAIALIAGLAIGFSSNRPETAQMVFTATIPLLASVLAYYFFSESLEAATRSVKALTSVEEKLETIPDRKWDKVQSGHWLDYKRHHRRKFQTLILFFIVPIPSPRRATCRRGEKVYLAHVHL
jgi:hypothetical protein